MNLTLTIPESNDPPLTVTIGSIGPAGPPGADGNSADITAESIADALGYVPADAATALQVATESKTTPVDADTVDLQDSAASGARKLLTFASLKTWAQGVINAMTTITGAKTLSGQLQLTGQAATDANSAMTRGLADARYGNYLFLIKPSDTSINSVSWANLSVDPHLVSGSLPAGTYHLRGLILVTVAPTNAPGYIICIRRSTLADFPFSCVNLSRNNHGSNVTQVNRIRGTVIGDSYPVVNAGAADMTGTPPYHTVKIDGVVTIVDGTDIAIIIGQNVSDAVNATTFKSGSFLEIRKVA
jgi:hypothetical protein